MKLSKVEKKMLVKGLHTGLKYYREGIQEATYWITCVALNQHGMEKWQNHLKETQEALAIVGGLVDKIENEPQDNDEKAQAIGGWRSCND